MEQEAEPADEPVSTQVVAKAEAKAEAAKAEAAEAKDRAAAALKRVQVHNARTLRIVPWEEIKAKEMLDSAIRAADGAAAAADAANMASMEAAGATGAGNAAVEAAADRAVESKVAALNAAVKAEKMQKKAGALHYDSYVSKNLHGFQYEGERDIDGRPERKGKIFCVHDNQISAEWEGEWCKESGRAVLHDGSGNGFIPFEFTNKLTHKLLPEVKDTWFIQGTWEDGELREIKLLANDKFELQHGVRARPLKINGAGNGAVRWNGGAIKRPKAEEKKIHIWQQAQFNELRGSKREGFNKRMKEKGYGSARLLEAKKKAKKGTMNNDEDFDPYVAELWMQYFHYDAVAKRNSLMDVITAVPRLTARCSSCAMAPRMRSAATL